MKAKKLYFKETHLAGRQYHDCDEVFDELKVGTLLRLERDLDNRFDHNAVAVVSDRPYPAAEGQTPSSSSATSPPARTRPSHSYSKWAGPTSSSAASAASSPKRTTRTRYD